MRAQTRKVIHLSDHDARIVLGDRAAELRAVQLLAIALTEQADRLAGSGFAKPCSREVPALLIAASRSLGVGTCVGLDTPLEVIALSARNTFELWLRLIHICASDANCLQWRGEAFADQIQVYRSLLKLGGHPDALEVIAAELARVEAIAATRGTKPSRPLMAHALARGTSLELEYEAFYKLYSKLVHPSSWAVNWPQSAAAPVYRAALVFNAQLYGWRILEFVAENFGISAPACYDAAVSRAERKAAETTENSRPIPH